MHPKHANDVPPCTECGRCCFSRMEDYIRVMGVDYDRLGDDAEHLTHFIGNRVYMRMQEGHCAALVYEGGRFACSIYEKRPDVCRWLERGTSTCRAERHEKAERSLVMIRRHRSSD